jgi:hypothetical protein
MFKHSDVTSHKTYCISGTKTKFLKLFKLFNSFSCESYKTENYSLFTRYSFEKRVVVAKSAYYLRHYRLSNGLSACIGMAPTRRIRMKFVVEDFHENMSR